jgi:GIY-YIG catalytic domain
MAEITQVNKYNHSKIYKICSNLTDKIYVGSTTQTLAQRLRNHTSDYKQYIRTDIHYVTSYEIIKLGDSYITLIEENNFNNRQQLDRREGEIIKLNINNVVNKQITGRTDAEYMVDNKHKRKQYKVDNAEYIKQIKKQYYINNKQQTIICECGSTMTNSVKQRHMKSPKHINLINQQLFNNELNHYNF